MDEVEGGLLPVSCFDLVQMVIVLVGSESNYWLPLSLTDSVRHSDSRLVDLIDVTLACEDGNSKLDEVVTVTNIDDEDHVGDSLLHMEAEV